MAVKMKKFISFGLTVVMLVSAFCITSNAYGALIFKDDFNSGMSVKNWAVGDMNHFYYDGRIDTNNPGNGVIIGYSDAVVLQSKYADTPQPRKWDKFYAEIDVNLRDVDDADTSNPGHHGLSLWYRDIFDPADTNGAETEAGPAYTFEIDIDNNTAYLRRDGHSFIYEDESGAMKTGEIKETVLDGPVELPYELVLGEFGEEKWFTIGMRVTDGKIECYFDHEKILESSFEDHTEMIGKWCVDAVDQTVGKYKSPILFWNGDMYLWLDNFEVWAPEYADDFIGIIYGDVNGNNEVESDDVVTIMKHIAGWNMEDMNEDVYNLCGDVNLDGNVDLYDATMILQSIAGWRIDLGEVSE